VASGAEIRRVAAVELGSGGERRRAVLAARDQRSERDVGAGRIAGKRDAVRRQAKAQPSTRDGVERGRDVVEGAGKGCSGARR
jgi:hypothetical protein